MFCTHEIATAVLLTCFLSMANCGKKNHTLTTIYGEGKSCDIADYNYFAVVYAGRSVCGAGLISPQWALLSGSCYRKNLQQKCRKGVRAGLNPFFQYRCVVASKSCHKTMGCDIAVVKVRPAFKANSVLGFARPSKPDIMNTCKAGIFLHTTFKHPWRKRRPLNLFCTKINLVDCEDSDFCGDVEEEPDDEDDYQYVGDDGRLETQPIITRRGGIFHDYFEEEIMGDQGICKHNSGGPLVYGDVIIGFLLGQTCPEAFGPGSQVPEGPQHTQESPGSQGSKTGKLGFTSVVKHSQNIALLTGVDVRTLNRARSLSDGVSSKGRSLHKPGGFHMKFLFFISSVLLFIIFD